MAVQQPENRSQQDRVLAGGGEMGRLMRAHDWSASAVGPVEDWPQSLRTAVSILLASGYPMLVVWGPEFVQFYNDAYRPVLGAKHPAALGQTTPECWSEIWDSMLEPMFHRVTDTGVEISAKDLMFPLERHGFTEECYFDFSYSPIRDERFEVGGILVTCSETTARVLSERRLKALREVADTSARVTTAEEACRCAAEVLGRNRADLPFALIYLAEADGTAAWLAGSMGIDTGDPAAPDRIDLMAPSVDTVWPVGEVLARHSTLPMEQLPTTASSVSGGPWPEPPQCALMLPIAQPGQDAPAGVLIAGISPRLQLDADYRSFLTLVAGQIATAVSNARAHEEERRRAEALAELDRAKTTFFSNVSHEFRTPLSLLLGPLEDGLADRDAVLPERQRERLEMARRNALRLLKLVNSLLDFSRIEAGRMQAVYEATDLASTTCDLASSFRSAIERAGLQFHVECDDLGQPVFVDREMWEKIVLNLLSNAFKFTFEGQIALRLSARGDAAELCLEDTGIGIPEEQLPHIFERFHRVEGAPARTQEGSGIGLALVQELVRLHGGSIQVASTLGKGTTFTVRIPFGAAHLPTDRINARRRLESTSIGAEPFIEEALRWFPPSETTVAAPATAQTEAASVALGRILIVDDNADMREYLRRLLSEFHTVEVAADGRAALDQARSNPPDLVLSDVMMPGLDGFQLLSALRADPATRLIPVVLLSARAGEEARVEGVEAGADDYLVKPFSARELLARVNSNLERSRLRREAMRLEQLAREQAEQQRERLRQLFEQAPAVMCLLAGPEHVFTLANAQYLAAIGERPIIGKPIRAALPEVEGQGFFELLDRVYATATAVVGREARVMLARGPDGALEEAFFDFVYAPIRDAAGQVQGVFVHGFEVTELVHARHTAEARRRQLTAILSGMADGVTAQAPDGQLLYANDAMARFMGLASAEAMLRLTPEERFALVEVFDEHGAPLAPADLPGRQLLRGTPARDRLLRYVMKATREQRWVIVKARPVLDERGHLEMVINISEDITLIKELDAQRQAFLSAAAHDLKTPITAVRGSAQLVHRRLERLHVEDRVIADLLRGMDTSTRKMASLIDELLDVSRLESSGELVLHPATTNLTVLVHELITQQQVLTPRHTLRLVDDDGDIIGRWDPERLERVIANLVSNAVKFSPDGGDVVVSVAKQVHEGQPWAVLSVQDRGVGIPTGDIGRIFQRFERGTNVADIPGSGIGLAYVRDVAVQHGGSVSVTSSVGQGSTFTLRLPVGDV